MSNEKPNAILASGDDALGGNLPNLPKHRFVKAGQSFRGRMIDAPLPDGTKTMFIRCAKHGDFNLKIQTHACLDPQALDPRNGKVVGKTSCLSCQSGLRVNMRVVSFWWDIDKREIAIIDAATGDNANGLKSAKGNYGDDLYVDTYQVEIGAKGAVAVSYLKPKKGEEFEVTPPDTEVNGDLLDRAMNIFPTNMVEKFIEGKVGQAKSESGGDAKIESLDGQTPAIGADGTHLF